MSTKFINAHRRSNRIAKRVPDETEGDEIGAISDHEVQGSKRFRHNLQNSIGNAERSTVELERNVEVLERTDFDDEEPMIENRTTLTLSQRRMLRKGQKNAEITAEHAQSGATTPTTSRGSSMERNVTPNLVSADKLNNCKVKLSEVTKEKRTQTAAINALTDKCDRQERDIRRQTQEITALQALVKQSNRKGRKSSKKGCWNKEDENSPIAEFKGIRFQLDLIVNEHARLIVTESTLTTNGLTQIRDWSCSSTVVTRPDSLKAIVFVYLPNGLVAIPSCTMLRASHAKFYVDRYDSTSSFTRDVTRCLLDGSAGRGMTDEDKEDCITNFSNYPGVLSKFRTALREETNNCKQGGKITYLKAIGYRKAQLGEMKNDENENKLREEEKKIVFEKCYKEYSDGQPDTMHWRLSPYSALRSVHRDAHSDNHYRRMLSSEEAVNNNGAIDTLFINEPARMAFTHIRGYVISPEAIDTEQDVSILTLARADAWMTLAMMNISVKAKGGNRSNKAIQKYEQLVLSYLDRIINDVWEDIKTLTPSELAVRLERGGGSMDPYCNNARKWTAVIESPNDGYLYLLATPDYFTSNICSWFGKVKDMQIGRCKRGSEKFERITKKLNFNQLEDSDIDDSLDEQPRTPISSSRTNSELLTSSVLSRVQ